MGNGASAKSPRDPNQAKKDKNKNNKKSKRKLQTQKSVHSWDAMISYSHQDTDEMLKLKSHLEKHGLSVWVDVVGLKAGVDFLSKIGQAIIDAKLFISLLSTNTATSKYCQDELALAYISNKPIFPIGLQETDKLYENMDTGMRLQLARYEWTMFLDEDEYDVNMELLTSRMKNKLATMKKEESSASSVSLTKKELSSEEKKKILEENKKEYFWERHFKVDDKVPWDRFVALLKEDFTDDIQSMFKQSDYDWLLSVLARELNIEEFDGNVTHDEYLMFCTVDHQYISFWERVKDQAIESYTMKEVFDMDSSVRVEAIENLAKFRSRTVVEALIDLLTDNDKNVQTVAAISLARTGAREPRVIRALLKTLSSKDRLVRESGCLALGHLKVEEAVPKIVHLWRNDVISSVREAAQVALEQIGGEEAEKAMHMTRVLTDEIRMLMQE